MKLIKRKEAVALGLKRYRTGKPCPQGHLDERYVSGKGCVACNRNAVAVKRKANPVIEKARNAKWYRANSEKKRKYSAEWKKANPERAKHVNAEWYRNNPDYSREKCARRRAAMSGAEGSYTPKDLKQIYAYQKAKCAACKGSLKALGYHADHINPLSKGGSNDAGNIQLLCPSCNCQKKDKDPYEWAVQRGMLI